jgi:hypothetical protein
VKNEESAENRFNGFARFPMKTVKTVSQQCGRLSTGLKPGVNEKGLLRQSRSPGRTCRRSSLRFNFSELQVLNVFLER